MFAGIQTILVEGRETIRGRWPSFISKAARGQSVLGYDDSTLLMTIARACSLLMTNSLQLHDTTNNCMWWTGFTVAGLSRARQANTDLSLHAVYS
jgi:hypothetical protein